jgi:hypothetical protein
MNFFVIHKGEDFESCEKLWEKIKKHNPSINFLTLTDGGENWFREAKEKIKASDCVLVCVGKKTHESENVDKEIYYATKIKKRIFVYIFEEDCVINDSLYINDKYMQVKFHKNAHNYTKRPNFTVIDLAGFDRLASDGYDFYIRDEINKTDNPKRIEELISQYQIYVQTSESIVERRQTVSSFYIGINTAIITAISTIVGILIGMKSINNKLISIGVVLFVVSILGIVLNINWFLQLDSYGKLNSAKMKVISAIEKQLPANIFDTEWRVMSDKIGAKRYRSFTNIEKTVPLTLSFMFIIILIAAVVLLICGFF